MLAKSVYNTSRMFTAITCSIPNCRANLMRRTCAFVWLIFHFEIISTQKLQQQHNQQQLSTSTDRATNYYRPPHLALPYAQSTSTLPRNLLFQTSSSTSPSTDQKTSANFFDYRPPSLFNSLFDQPSQISRHPPQQVANMVSCTFEYNMCGWRQLMSPADHFDWLRHTGPVGVNLFQPTIRGDHTTGYGAYMLLTTPSAPATADTILGTSFNGGGGGSISASIGAGGKAGAAGTAANGAAGGAAARAAPDPEMEPEDMLMQRMMTGGGGGAGGGAGGGGFLGSGLSSLFGFPGGGGGFHGNMGNSPMAALTSSMPSSQADPAASLLAMLLSGGRGGGSSPFYGGGGQNTNQMSQLMMHQMFKRQATVDTGQPVDTAAVEKKSADFQMMLPQYLQGPHNGQYNYQQQQQQQLQNIAQPSQQRIAAQTSQEHGGTRVLEPHEVLAAFQINSSPRPHTINEQQQRDVPPSHVLSPHQQQQNYQLIDQNHHHQRPKFVSSHAPVDASAQFQQQPVVNYLQPSQQQQQQLPQYQQHQQPTTFMGGQHHSMTVQHQPPGVPPHFSSHFPPSSSPFGGGIFPHDFQPPLQHHHPFMQTPMHMQQPMQPPLTNFAPPPGGIGNIPPPHVPGFDAAYPPPMAGSSGLMPVIPGFTPTGAVPPQYNAPPDQMGGTVGGAGGAGGMGGMGGSSGSTAGGGAGTGTGATGGTSGTGNAGTGTGQVLLSPHPNPFAESPATANTNNEGNMHDISSYHPIAQLISPPIYVDGEQINGNFSFWYHLRGAFGRITVYKRHMDHFIPDETLWEVAGHQSWTWKQAVVRFPAPPLSYVHGNTHHQIRNVPFQIIIEGSLKVGVPTFIGFDDVVLSGEEDPFLPPPHETIPQNKIVYLEPSGTDGIPMPIPHTALDPAQLPTTTTTTITPTRAPKSPGIMKPKLPLYPHHDVNDRMGPGLMGPTTDDPMSRRHKLLFGVRQSFIEEESTTTTILMTTQPTTTPITTPTTTIAPFTEWWPPVTLVPNAKPDFLFANGKDRSRSGSVSLKDRNKHQITTTLTHPDFLLPTRLHANNHHHVTHKSSLSIPKAHVAILTSKSSIIPEVVAIAVDELAAVRGSSHSTTPTQPIPMRFKKTDINNNNVDSNSGFVLEREDILSNGSSTTPAFPHTKSPPALVATVVVDNIPLVNTNEQSISTAEFNLVTLPTMPSEATIMFDTTSTELTTIVDVANTTDIYTEIYTTDITVEYINATVFDGTTWVTTTLDGQTTPMPAVNVSSRVILATTPVVTTNSTLLLVGITTNSTVPQKQRKPSSYPHFSSEIINHNSSTRNSTTTTTTRKLPATSTTPAYQAYIAALRNSIIRKQERKTGGVYSSNSSSKQLDSTASTDMIDGIAFVGGPVMLANKHHHTKNSKSALTSNRDAIILLLSGANDTSSSSTTMPELMLSHAALVQLPSATSLDRPVNSRVLPTTAPTISAATAPASALIDEHFVAGISIPLSSASRSGGGETQQSSGSFFDGQQHDASLPKAVVIFGFSFAGFVMVSLILIGVQQLMYSGSANPFWCSRTRASHHYYESSNGSRMGDNNNSIRNTDSSNCAAATAATTTDVKQPAGRTHSGITQASFDIYESIRGGTHGNTISGVGPRTAGPRAESSASSQVYFASWSQQRGCRFQPNEYAGSSSSASSDVYENNISTNTLGRPRPAAKSESDLRRVYDNTATRQLGAASHENVARQDDTYDNSNNQVKSVANNTKNHVEMKQLGNDHVAPVSSQGVRQIKMPATKGDARQHHVSRSQQQQKNDSNKNCLAMTDVSNCNPARIHNEVAGGDNVETVRSAL